MAFICMKNARNREYALTRLQHMGICAYVFELTIKYSNGIYSVELLTPEFLFLFTQPKPVPRSFWLIDPPKIQSSVRAPTQRNFLFDVLCQTHSKVKASTAVERTVEKLVKPFYKEASLPTLARSNMGKIIVFWHHE